MTIRSFVCIAALIATLGWWPPLVRAAVVTPPTFDALVATAGDIFLGQVVSIASRFEQHGAKRLIVTDVTFRTEEVLKGTPDALRTLTFIGGHVGELRMEVPGSPTFMVGDRDVIFVHRGRPSLMPIVGLFHGRFRVVTGPGGVGTFVANNSRQPIASVGEYARPSRALAATRPLALVDFLRTIRSMAAGR